MYGADHHMLNGEIEERFFVCDPLGEGELVLITHLTRAPFYMGASSLSCEFITLRLGVLAAAQGRPLQRSVTKSRK